MSLTDLVNPLCAVDPPGHCLPGPYLPLGLVRLGPDTAFPHPTNGYRSDHPIIRFSHTHVAGTGGPGRYGNVGITPFCGDHEVIHAPPYLLAPSSALGRAGQSDENASVGYYSVRLEPAGILAELTCSRHVGVHRYTYPEGAAAGILVDGGAVIQTMAAGNSRIASPEFWDSAGTSIGGMIEIVSDTEVIGRCDLRGGWGHDQPYSVFFCLQSNQTIGESSLASAGGFVPGGIGSTVVGPDCRAALHFGNVRKLELRVGISFTSVARAKAHVAREAAGRDFGAVRKAHVEEWERLLAGIRVEGGTNADRRLFYTLFYRLMCMPTDLGVDAENPAWHSGVRHFWDFYCLWDSVRNANSLIGLFAPELHRDMLNSLLDTAEQTGWLPDTWIAGHHAFQQSGCSCEILFREAFAKGLEGVDYRRALHFMLKNAEAPTPDPVRKGRYLEYQDRGYLPEGIPNCLSRFIEYTYLDWCIARMLDALGEPGQARRFDRYAAQVWNLWRDEQTCFWPRDREGNWVSAYDPSRIRPDGWNDAYVYEAIGRCWTLCVFQDFPGLIDRFGGRHAFSKHLDRHFEEHWFTVKETKMHTPYLYVYAGRPDRTAERVRASLRASFSNTRDGLHDNEDMGCQSAYFMCGALGLYPVMGQPLWFMCPPLFDRVEMALGATGRALLITVERTSEGRYIREARLNGQPLDRAWLRHREIADGAELELVLGDSPTDWGTQALPPVE